MEGNYFLDELFSRDCDVAVMQRCGMVKIFGGPNDKMVASCVIKACDKTFIVVFSFYVES